MHVPNFVPEPIQIEGSVANAPWRAQIEFLRRVALAHAGCWAIVALFWTERAEVSTLEAGILAIFALVVTHLVSYSRRYRRGFLMALALACLGIITHRLNLWSPFVTASCFTLYILLAQKNYSRTGHFLLSLIASATIIAVIAIATHQTPEQTRIQEGLNLGLLLYLVTDLTSITFRRLPEEAVDSATDLFSDVFSFITWFRRTQAHLVKHKLLPFKKEK